MTGWEIFVGALTSVALYFSIRNLLFKEVQYTPLGWLCLAACISLALSVGQFLINT